MKKFLIFISIIFLSIFAFFFSNIKGYYRFKQYCEAEGGLRVYEPLERNVGWAAKDKEHAAFTSVLDSVGFVRYIENDKELDHFRSEEHTSELQSRFDLVCRLLL